ncbi:uncharacterized protein LOC109707573 [Ananas comosus]|uniref:Uncharacterized protein LOC109707573 n=2 Tax=Ananas comosus TaxID=4615 RepID=A0A199UDP5_ANACO|nr:uncharacterized protein LOC109707573 [Ananas comosus]OAY62670.1 hypothetical protein ACMD2_12433 [Ananas comosus]CAD1845035.1 unnamed protein product [Ananas comosus var. bracteatus]
MWVEILCGVVIYQLLRRYFAGDEEFPDVDSSHSDVAFAVAARLEKIYGGKSFVGLRIPDHDSGSRCHIDVVLVTKRELMVVAVRNFAGFVEVDKDGNWVCTTDKKHRPETHPNPVREVGKQVEILRSYLEQRGVPLPEGHIIGRVVLPNPNCRPSYSITFQPEAISFDKWRELKPDSSIGISSWIKDAFKGSKSEQDGFNQKLEFILSTSPMWDRLELKGDRNILGEFMEFKGNQDDVQALRNLKRSKVSQFIIQKPSMLGFGRSRLQILYSSRDYRSEGSLASEWKEVAVKPHTEVLFQPLHSKKARKFKLSSVVSMTLSA